MDQQAISLHYQRMGEWLNDRKIVLRKKFKKEYDRLHELSPRLEQMVRYDIPALRKQEKRLTSALDDAHRSIEESAKATVTLHEKRMRTLHEYGLTAKENMSEDELDAAVDTRISQSTTLLNESLRDFSAAHLRAFCDDYDSFLKEHSMGMYAAGAFAAHFPWLHRALEDCGCSVSPDTRAAEAEAEAEAEADAAAAEAPGEIDWGDAADAAAPADAIDVRWSADAEEAEEAEEAEALPPRAGGVFSLCVSSGPQRSRVLAELRALRCFAEERPLRAELRDAAAALEERLTESAEAQFLRMRGSRALRHALVEDVQRFQRSIMAAAARRGSSESRVQQLQAEIEQVEPQLQALVAAARTCRDECITELQKMFPGRTIAIIGDITKNI